jgi:hypothetical protein
LVSFSLIRVARMEGTVVVVSGMVVIVDQATEKKSWRLDVYEVWLCTI